MGEAVAWWKIVPYSAFFNHRLHMNLTDFFLKGQKLWGAKWQIKLYEFSFPILEERMQSPLGQASQLCASPGDLSVPCRAETNISMFVGLAMASSNCRSSLLLLSFPQTIYRTATSELVIPSGTRWNQGAKSPGRREWSWSLSWRICILTCEKPSEAWEVSPKAAEWGWCAAAENQHAPSLSSAAFGQGITDGTWAHTRNAVRIKDPVLFVQFFIRYAAASVCAVCISSLN